MIKIQSPGIFSGNYLDYDNNHTINEKIDELVASNAYAVCDTAGDTAAKTITIQNYELRTGVQLVVKFANTNSEENPTLNVSNTGAKPIYANGQAVGLSVIKSGYAFIIAYNGTQYEIVGGVSGSDMFIGTTAEWEALSSTQKAEYDGKIVNITDDYEAGEFAINGVIAPNEISPTRESHVLGSYITFNNSIYVCKTNIAKNETLIIDTNIELASLPEKTVVCYDDDEPEPYTKPGHTIITSSGSSSVDRAGLQFGTGFDVADDPTNNKTIVTPGDILARKSDVATIVCTGSTNTTGSTIAAGVYFYLNGALCKAKTDIANGATFTLNTNFEVVSICEELTQLNSKTEVIDVSNLVHLNEGYFLSSAKKQWNIVSICFTTPKYTSQRINVNIGYVDSPIRPYMNTSPSGALTAATANDFGYGFCAIGSVDGKIWEWYSVSSSQYGMYCTITYIIP